MERKLASVSPFLSPLSTLDHPSASGQSSPLELSPRESRSNSVSSLHLPDTALMLLVPDDPDDSDHCDSVPAAPASSVRQLRPRGILRPKPTRRRSSSSGSGTSRGSTRSGRADTRHQHGTGSADRHAFRPVGASRAAAADHDHDHDGMLRGSVATTRSRSAEPSGASAVDVGVDNDNDDSRAQRRHDVDAPNADEDRLQPLDPRIALSPPLVSDDLTPMHERRRVQELEDTPELTISVAEPRSPPHASSSPSVLRRRGVDLKPDATVPDALLVPTPRVSPEPGVAVRRTVSSATSSQPAASWFTSPVAAPRIGAEATPASARSRASRASSATASFVSAHSDLPSRKADAPTSPGSSSVDASGPEVPPLSFWGYVQYEMRRGHTPIDEEGEQMQRQQRVYDFLHVPFELERLMLFAFFLCADSFLFLFTFLPLRTLSALADLITVRMLPWNRLTRTQVCDLLRFSLGGLCLAFLWQLQPSILYHYIRGQAVIKLYVIFNVLEIFDKLCSSFGQDILESLFCSATEVRGYGAGSDVGVSRVSLATQYIVALLYLAVHSTVLYTHVITLNVAINSHNALLTLLISNNFVELKGSVFKKFEKQNLFQITCSDIVERFQLTVYVLLILVSILSELSWDLSSEYVHQLVLQAVVLLASECVVDWIKHAFITKFNRISPTLYSKFYTILCRDLATARSNRFAFLDPSHVVSRRLGFASLPLCCLVLRVTLQYLPHTRFAYLFAVIFFLCMLVLKVLISVLLLGHALTRRVPTKPAASSPVATSPPRKPDTTQQQAAEPARARTARVAPANAASTSARRRSSSAIPPGSMAAAVAAAAAESGPGTKPVVVDDPKLARTQRWTLYTSRIPG